MATLRSRLARNLTRAAAAVIPFVTVMAASGAADASNHCSHLCSDRRLKRDIRPI